MNFFRKYKLIQNYLVETRIITYLYECEYQQGCSSECCSIGAWITGDEIKRVQKALNDIAPYLNDAKKRRLKHLRNRFIQKSGWAGTWKIRTWKSSCIFLMDNGACAVHRYCLDNGIDWIRFKFDICATFPLIIYYEKRLIRLINSGWEVVACLNLSDEEKQKKQMKPLVYSMKDILIDRLGMEFWNALEFEYLEISKKQIKQ